MFAGGPDHPLKYTAPMTRPRTIKLELDALLLKLTLKIRRIPLFDFLAEFTLAAMMVRRVIQHKFFDISTAGGESPEGIEETRDVEFVDDFDVNTPAGMTRKQANPSLDV